MFAVVRTGGKQYRIAADQKITVDRLPGEAGDTVTLGDVLLMGEGGELKAATDGQTVTAEIVAQTKGDKIIIFKKKRRHNYRRRNGHRQLHTVLKIVAIGGEAAPKKAAKAKAEPNAAVETVPVAEAAPAPKAVKAKAPKAEAAGETAAPKKTAKPKADKAEPAAE